MKKIISILLALLMLLGASSPALATTVDTAIVVTVTTQGFGGEFDLQVTFTGNKITDVKVLENSETPGVSDAALEEVPKAIVEHNSILVDTVSGATFSSTGIIEGVIKAIEEAGLDLADFENEVVNDNAGGQDLTYDTDIVVIGGGIAGLAAGLEATLNGASVIVLEKMPTTGGSTMRSGGLILAADSSVSKEAENDDSWETLADYWYEVSEEMADREFIDWVAEHSGENVDWMIENGVEMSADIWKLHSSHPFTYGHSTAIGSGIGFTQPLNDKILELGGEILTSTTATELIVEDDVVVGVKAIDDDENNITVNAKAVIIATGGFAASQELMSEYMPYLKYGSAMHNGNPGNTGDGITMSKAVDAQLAFYDSGINLGVNPITYYGYGEEYTGLYVTPAGERFMDESDFHFVRTRILMDLDVNDIWAITDQTNDRVEATIEDGHGFAADSIEELAELIDIDADVLQATVDRYNELSANGLDEDYEKDASLMKAIEGPTYYALKLYMGNSGSIGGIVTTIDGEVLNNDDEVVEGLYAVGEVASSQVMYKAYPGSGSAIAFYLAFGRQAGRAAAEVVK